jgi:hypothetical protein
MSTPNSPSTYSTASLVDDYDLTFDPGDKLNGSLYLCTPRGTTAPDSVIAGLRAGALWSSQAWKQVGDEQRQAYKDGLIFVAAIAYRAASGHLLIARFDHPKFPSDSRRWEAWVDHFDARYERVR